MSDSQSAGPYPVLSPGSEIMLRSTSWLNAYLYVDKGMASPNGAGGGKVTCRYLAPSSAPTTDKGFLLKAHNIEGTDLYAFESVAFPNNYLRLDGHYSDTPGGTGPAVNLQYATAPAAKSPPKEGAWELFKVGIQPGSAFGEFFIQSNRFPHASIIFDGANVTKSSPDGGEVRGGYSNSQGAVITGWYELP